MTPAARVQARIEILERIFAAQAPADRVLGDYTRARRYMGAKDRRAVVEGTYSVLRHRARLTWWYARVSGDSAVPDARALVIAALALAESLSAAGIAALFDGAAYHPAPLCAAEQDLAAALAGQEIEHRDQDPETRLEIPPWLRPGLEAAFGPELEAEMLALNRPAPMDLRVNTLKAGREEARAALAAEGIEAAPHPFAPLALRLEARAPVQNARAFREGLVEVQDAGSQIAAQLCAAAPGMAVADLCAGAGGKTLALAAAMENRGRLIALEVEQARLDRAAARLRRAGASLVERRVLRGTDWLQAQAGGFERVLVDAPCSGSGAWRRDPFARWQLDPERLALYGAAQADSLDKAAGLVSPGGRLVYVTCSLLPEENEVRVEAFLKARGGGAGGEAGAGFTLLPAARIWDETLGRLGAAPPRPAPFAERFLRLTPARHGTDGFFVAVLERNAAA